jgi:hypothetical protein
MVFQVNFVKFLVMCGVFILFTFGLGRRNWTRRDIGISFMTFLTCSFYVWFSSI